MRLPVVDHGHRWRERLVLCAIRVLARLDPPDVLKTLLYRPAYFGKHLSAWVQEALRGPSSWSVGERELMAAFTSQLNECRF